MELPKKVKTSNTAKAPPGQVAKGESFTFEGILTDKDTGEPVADKTVDLYVDGAYAGSVTTMSDGSWAFDVTIAEAGTYTIYADFPGDATAFGSSPESSTGWLVPAGLLAVAGLVIFITR